MTDFLTNGNNQAPWTVALAHGAGAAMDSPFMNRMAGLLADGGLHVARFEFPYMVERRTSGKRKGPDRPPVLLDTWRSVIAELKVPRERLVIGGKSMGGRIASMVADEQAVAGLVCLGYPFHPAGRPLTTRTAHLTSLRTPTLILQGTRDTLGNVADVKGYKLSRTIRVHWLDDGDHDLKPRKASGRTHEQNLADAARAAVGFVTGL